VVAVGGIPALYLVSAAMMLLLVFVAVQARQSHMIPMVEVAVSPRPSAHR
jgi:hypothetical protein